MNDLSVDVSRLNGFKLDLQDIASNSSRNATLFHSGLSLPAGATGRFAELVSPLEKFRSAHFIALQNDTTAMDELSQSLGTTAAAYQTTDDNNANDVASLSDSGSNITSTAGISRYGGLQLPALQEVADEPFTLQNFIASTIAQLSPYDDSLHTAMGIKPIEKYLTPLLADWEALETIGKRIGMLGINDFVTAQNITNGSLWLKSEWSGSAADSFAANANALGHTISLRSNDLDSVSKIVENGSACLERLVYNQASDLSSRILKSITCLEMSFPLGAWANQVNLPIPGDIKSQITAGVDEIKQCAESRNTTLSTVIDKISQALDFTPGRTVPLYNASDFEVPERVVTDAGTRRFGINDSAWWEETPDVRA